MKKIYLKKKVIILLKKAFKNIILTINQVIFDQYQHFMSYINHEKI